MHTSALRHHSFGDPKAVAPGTIFSEATLKVLKLNSRNWWWCTRYHIISRKIIFNLYVFVFYSWSIYIHILFVFYSCSTYIVFTFYLCSIYIWFVVLFCQHISSSSPEMALREEEISPSFNSIPPSMWQSRRQRKRSLPPPPFYFDLRGSRRIYLLLLFSSSSSLVKVTEEKETVFEEVISSSTLPMILSRRRKRKSPPPSPSSPLCQSRQACPCLEHGPLPATLPGVILLLLLIWGEGDLLRLPWVFSSIKPPLLKRRAACRCRNLPRQLPSLHQPKPRTASLHPSLPCRTPSRLSPRAGTNKGIQDV